MTDGEDCPLEVQKIVLQPLDSVEIQMVGGLVQKKDFRVLQDQTGEVQAGFLAAGQALKTLCTHVRADLESVGDAIDGDVGLVAAETLIIRRQPVVFRQKSRRAVVLHLSGKPLHALTDGVHMAEGILQDVFGRPAVRVHRQLRDQTDAL